MSSQPPHENWVALRVRCFACACLESHALRLVFSCFRVRSVSPDDNMDLDHPDDEPPRSTTPRPSVELSRMRVRIGSRSLILMNQSSLMEPRSCHPWMATHIGRGTSTGSLMIQPQVKMRAAQFTYGGTTFGSCKIGAVKGINVFFRNRTPLTPTWIHTRLS